MASTSRRRRPLFEAKAPRRSHLGAWRIAIVAPPRPWKDLSPDDLVDVGDLCALFACSVGNLRHRIYRSQLTPTWPPADLAGRPPFNLFSKRDVERWLEKHEPPGLHKRKPARAGQLELPGQSTGGPGS